MDVQIDVQANDRTYDTQDAHVPSITQWNRHSDSTWDQDRQLPAEVRKDRRQQTQRVLELMLSIASMKSKIIRSASLVRVMVMSALWIENPGAMHASASDTAWKGDVILTKDAAKLASACAQLEWAEAGNSQSGVGALDKWAGVKGAAGYFSA